MLGELDAKPVPRRVPGREQLKRELGELGGAVGRSARASATCSLLELTRHPLVGAIAGEREVASPLLRIRDGLGERSVRRSPPLQRGGRVHGRCVERMYELDAAVGTDLHELRVFGRGKRLRVHEPHLGPPERSCREQRITGGRRKRVDPGRHQRAQVVRHRQRRRGGSSLVAPEQARDLERVQRIAARRLSDPHEGRPWEAPAQRIGDDAVERGHRQRPQLEKLQRPVTRGGCDQRPLGVLRAHRDDAHHRLVLDPPERELDRRRGRRVEPLEVVDRDHDDCTVRREPAEHREQRGTDEPSLGRTARADSQQRDVQCHALRRRQPRQGVLVKMRQEIGKAGE